MARGVAAVCRDPAAGVAAAAALLSLMTFGVWAETPRQEEAVAATARSGPQVPYSLAPRADVSKRVPDVVRARLASAFDEAERRVLARPECAALFHPLDLPALTALDFSLYYPANPYEEATVCRHVVAFSRVLGGPIHLCRRFAVLNDEQAARAVLHEALHRAGLGECFTDPNGLLPMEVQDMVVAACGASAAGPHPDLRRAAIEPPSVHQP